MGEEDVGFPLGHRAFSWVICMRLYTAQRVYMRFSMIREMVHWIGLALGERGEKGSITQIDR